MLTILSRDNASIALRPRHLAPTTLPIKLSQVGEHQYDPVLKIFESAQELIRRAGALDFAVSHAAVIESGHRIVGIAQMFSAPDSAPSLQFSSPWPHDAILPEVIDVLYIDAIEFGGIALAFSAIAKMTSSVEAELLQWESRSITPIEIAVVRDLASDYEAFSDRSKAEIGIDTVMMATYNLIDEA
jgi:hypothetical protein